MNEVNIPKDVLHNAIIEELHLLGIKNGLIPKGVNKVSQVGKPASGNGQVFSKPLHRLPSRIVTLSSGVEAEVPVFIIEVCSLILKHSNVEGLFRKAGSSARQKELRITVNDGHRVDFSQHHVIDIANLLKSFLRELPEPLLPFRFHETFLYSLLLEDTIEAVLLICLLLPRSHLHVLAYIMEIVAGFSTTNRMDCSNLAIVLTPSVMPVTSKVSIIQNPQRLSAHVRIVELLISHAEKIGVLPDGVAGRLLLTPSASNLSLLSDEQNFGHMEGISSKKKRRSGSLTRMFNGLKKIVVGKLSPERGTGKQLEERAVLISSTPDFSTPCVKVSKKRKASDPSSAFSSKKKRDVLQALPQSTTLASTPFKHATRLQDTAGFTPRVCSHPNPLSQSPPKVNQRKFLTSKHELEKLRGLHSRKALPGVSSLVNKKQKQNSERRSAGGSFLERSWSAVSSSSWGRRKFRRSDDQNRLSLASSTAMSEAAEDNSNQDADVGIDLSEEDPSISSPSDFVRVPKTEYEQLKSRMSAIESRISQEFGSVLSEPSLSPEALSAAKSAIAVQTAYEKTLEGADVSKDSSADLLAKRLSRELKIRRSGECKVIRSPSARKIGSLRRRSRERQSPSVRRELRRNKSWHSMQRPSIVAKDSTQTHHSSSLRRGRPNTIFTGLPHPIPSRICKESKEVALGPSPSAGSRGHTRRTSSFHADGSPAARMVLPKKCNSQVTIAKAALLAHAQQRCRWDGSTDETWHDAQDIFNKTKELLDHVPASGRESIAKLRNENAGKVLATAKLFNASADAKSTNVKGNKVYEADSISPQTEAKCQSPANERGIKKSAEVLEQVQVAMPCVEPKGQTSASPSRKCNTRRHRPTKISSICESPSLKTLSPKVRKYNSLKAERRNLSQPVKRNLSVPVQKTDLGKENLIKKSSPKVSSFSKSPQLKESPSLMGRAKKLSVSPLRDCNRICVAQQPPLKTFTNTGSTPSIKQPLTSRSPRLKSFTPQSACSYTGQTPLRAQTPLVHPARRQSPRLLHQSVKGSIQIG